MSTTPPKPRRIRVCRCPHCGGFFKWQRIKKDDVPVQMCMHCYRCIDPTDMISKLEPASDHPHLP